MEGPWEYKLCMAISVLGHKEDALPCLVLLQVQDPMGFWKITSDSTNKVSCGKRVKTNSEYVSTIY